MNIAFEFVSASVEYSIDVDWDELSNELQSVVMKSNAYTLTQTPTVWVEKDDRVMGMAEQVILEIDSHRYSFAKSSLPSVIQCALIRDDVPDVTSSPRFFPEAPVIHTELKKRFCLGLECSVM